VNDGWCPPPVMGCIAWCRQEEREGEAEAPSAAPLRLEHLPPAGDALSMVYPQPSKLHALLRAGGSPRCGRGVITTL
jgi:hypothetical protein